MRFAWPAAATIFAWGVATFALVPPLQSRVMQTAADAPTLAASINIGAFNLGNALGAALGGGLIALGFAFAWVSVAGATLAFGALVLVRLAGRRLDGAPAAAALANADVRPGGRPRAARWR